MKISSIVAVATTLLMPSNGEGSLRQQVLGCPSGTWYTTCFYDAQGILQSGAGTPGTPESYVDTTSAYPLWTNNAVGFSPAVTCTLLHEKLYEVNQIDYTCFVGITFGASSCSGWSQNSGCNFSFTLTQSASSSTTNCGASITIPSNAFDLVQDPTC